MEYLALAAHKSLREKTPEKHNGNNGSTKKMENPKVLRLITVKPVTEYHNGNFLADGNET